MGRPIKKKYFANLNSPYNNFATGGATGVGGEGISTIAIANSGTLYAISTTLNLTFSSPDIGGGVKATGRATTNSSGNLATVTLTKAGSGYTGTPTVTVNGGTTGTTATFTIALTTTQDPGITVSAWVPGGSQALNADIMKQESTARYLVQTSEGSGVCKLVAAAPAVAGEMTIMATDSDNNSYYVTKLTARKARVTPVTGTYQFAAGTTVGWNLVAAEAHVSVKIGNA